MTTFSTLQVEALGLERGWAVLYLTASVVLGFLAVALGRRV